MLGAVLFGQYKCSKSCAGQNKSLGVFGRKGSQAPGSWWEVSNQAAQLIIDSRDVPASLWQPKRPHCHPLHMAATWSMSPTSPLGVSEKACTCFSPTPSHHTPHPYPPTRFLTWSMSPTSPGVSQNACTCITGW